MDYIIIHPRNLLQRHKKDIIFGENYITFAIMKIRSGFSGERSLVLPQVIVQMMEEDPMTSSLHISDLGYYPKAAHHYRDRNEPIDQCIFIYCIEGQGWYEIKGRRYEVGSNQYFILPANTPHTYAASEDNPWTIYWIHFRGTLAGEYAAQALEPQTINPGMGSRIQHRIDMFEEIYNTLHTSLTIASIRYAMAVFHHFIASLMYIREYRSVGSQQLGSSIVDSTIHFMRENIEKHLTLSDFAEYAGFSASHLSAMFKNETGHSPLYYFNLLKVRKACELLESTSMKLNQISFKIGITDPFYFSRLFSKMMGMSPKAYRTRPKT